MGNYIESPEESTKTLPEIIFSESSKKTVQKSVLLLYSSSSK